MTNSWKARRGIAVVDECDAFEHIASAIGSVLPRLELLVYDTQIHRPHSEGGAWMWVFGAGQAAVYRVAELGLIAHKYCSALSHAMQDGYLPQDFKTLRFSRDAPVKVVRPLAAASKYEGVVLMQAMVTVIKCWVDLRVPSPISAPFRSKKRVRVRPSISIGGPVTCRSHRIVETPDRV